MTTLPLHAAAPEPIYAVLTTRTQPAAWWEQLVVAAWVLCTFIDFPGNEFILYPCALIFMLQFVIYREMTFPIGMRSVLILLVPVLGALSWGWSPAPMEALRSGMMMILHFLIMVTIASRLNRMQIVRAVFFAGIVAIGFAAPLINTFETGGPYGSKNIFAIRMFICVLAALAVAFEAKEHTLLRLVAVPVAVVAALFMFVANSATALVFSVAGVALMTMLWMFWQPVARVQHLRTALVLILLVAVSVGLIVFLAIPNNNVVDNFLAALGKDSTLTNRTLIWEAGIRAADERPWLGYGFEGFWRSEVGAAQTLNELDHKDFGTKLSFHNAYIETRVALGYVGLVALLITIIWAYSRALFNWTRSQSMASSFLLTMATVVMVSTVTESYIFGVFETMSLLFYLAAITGFAEKYHSGQRQYVRLRANSV
jgi:exopolysaccharide production protein ExoQ